MGKGGKGGDGGAAQARADEMARQKRIREGTQRINVLFDGDGTQENPGQFGDSFYDARKMSYLDYATPQLNDQYAQAQKDLAFALDRSGMLDSSIRAQKQAELQKQYDINRQQVADKGLELSTQARGNVEDARANLISMLNATGDVEGAISSAMTRAKALSQPDTYSPLGQMFSSFTSGLGTQYAAEQARAMAASVNSGGNDDPYFRKRQADNSIDVRRRGN